MRLLRRWCQHHFLSLFGEIARLHDRDRELFGYCIGRRSLIGLLSLVSVCGILFLLLKREAAVGCRCPLHMGTAPDSWGSVRKARGAKGRAEMFRRKSGKPAPKEKRAWEEEVNAGDDQSDGGDDDAGGGGAPSEAFLSLQKELEEKETIQRENEERVKNQDRLAAEAARAAIEKEKKRRANAKNPRVFLDIEIADVIGADSRLKKGKRVGRIVLELFDDRLPKTAENFRALCTGEKPRGASGFPLCYLGNIFHRIVPKFMAQGGDITREDGSGGESIYGPTFADEGFSLQHDKPGLLSMANSGRNSNNSQFFITFAPLPWLDAKHVVFGKVIDGIEVVRQIEDCGTSSGEPTKRVQIAECGQLPDPELEKRDGSDKETDEKAERKSVYSDEEEEEGDGNGSRRGRKRARVTFAGATDDPSTRSNKGPSEGGGQEFYGSIASRSGARKVSPRDMGGADSAERVDDAKSGGVG